MSTRAETALLSRPRERPAWLPSLPPLVFVALGLGVVGVQTSLALDAVRDVGFLGARDSRWAIAIFAAVVLWSVGVAALAPRRLLWLAVAPAALGLAVTVVAVALAGGEIWPIAVAALTLSAAWLAGRWLLRLPRLRDEGLYERHLVALSVGLGALGVLVLALGRVGLLHWWTVGIATVALGALGTARLVRGHAPRAGLAALVSTRLRAGIAGILALQGSFAVLWAGAPDVQFDALWYKGWYPEVWAGTGWVDAQAFIDHPLTSIAGLAQLVAVPGHAVDAPAVGRYLQLLAGVIAVAAVWRAGARFGSAAGPLAALAVATAPHTVWQASTAYEELFLALPVLGIAAAILHYEDRPVRSAFLASLVVGLLAGACVTGKLHLGPFAIAACLVWLVVATGLPDLLRRLAGVLAGSLAFALPLLLFRWLETENPVFPYFNNIFQSPFFRTGSALTSFSGGDARSHGPSGELPLVLRVPWRILHDRNGLIEAAPAGIFGLLLAIAILALLLGWRPAPARRAVWGAFTLGLLGWWLQFQYLRFAYPLLVLGVIVALPALAGLDRLLRPRPATWAALAAVGLGACAFFVTSAASFWNVPGGVPLAAAVGKEPERDYTRRTILDATAFEVLNRLAEPDARMIGNVWARTLLRDDIDLTPDWELGDELHFRGRFTSDPGQLRDIFREHGAGWLVLADQKRLRDIETDYLALFARRYGQVVFADHLRDVYRIVESPPAPVSVPLCDETFLRQECWVTSEPLDSRPGITDAEVGGFPVSQTVPACGGATYAVEVTSAPGAEGAILFVIFDQPDPEQGFRYIVIPPGGTWVMHQTAPADAKTLTFVLDPLGPSAGIERVRLAIADTSLRGSPCP